jgi:hypothetical protein
MVASKNDRDVLVGLKRNVDSTQSAKECEELQAL